MLAAVQTPAPRRWTWVPALILVSTLALTAVSAYYTANAARERDHLRFKNDAEGVVRAVDARLEAYVAMLRAGRGLLAGDVEITRDQFRDFVASLELQAHYPGIQGLGYAVHVPPERLDAFVAAGREKLGEGFRLWPPGPRESYTAIVFLEPMDRRNLAAIGYDMFSEPVRQQAMARARDSGEPAASGRVTLVQEIEGEKQPGMLLYLPVYEGDPPATVEARRATLRGYVYGAFRMYDLLQGIVPGAASSPLAFAVYDVADGEDVLLYDSHPEADSPDTRVEAVSLAVAGRQWRLVFRARPSFEAASGLWLVPYVIGVGTLSALLLFLAAWALARERAAAVRIADELRVSEGALRESERALRRLVDAEGAARVEAEAASRAKDEFLATVSHELRTPLQAILGWAALLREPDADAAIVARAVETIERNARAQERLIADILDVARIVSGKLHLSVEAVDLRRTVQSAVEALRPTADARGVALVMRLDEVGRIAGDPARLQQVVSNLLTNAVKFTPQGGRVDVDLRREAGRLILEVRDTGQGIAPRFLPLVFDRFRQADASATRRHGGLGLGLAIVRHLVELHGGTVSAASEGQDRGATFTVALPFVEAGPEAQRPPTGEPPGAIPSLVGVSVLVVEDERDTRDVLARILGDCGAEVTTAASAAEAFALVEARRFDVLVGDIGMPGEDGLTLMRRVRALPPDRGAVPAVALTAFARPEDRHDALAAGFQVHLAKPVDAIRLTRTVAGLAGRGG